MKIVLDSNEIELALFLLIKERLPELSKDAKVRVIIDGEAVDIKDIVSGAEVEI